MVRKALMYKKRANLQYAIEYFNDEKNSESNLLYLSLVG